MELNTVTNVRLVTDRIGTLIGSYRVPGSDDPSTPVFETGRSVLRLTSSETDSRVEGLVSTSAEDIFYSQGDQDNTQEVTLSLRNARVTHDDSFVETRTIGDTATSSTTFTTGGGDGGRLTGEFTDPLAQSFIVDDVTGIYLTSVDVFFQEKPLEFDVPVTLQIREVELGVPNQRILPFSEVSLAPDDITTSNDASVPQKFTFESPVYLNGQREYAIVLLSNSTEYRVWISRLGESDVATLDRELDRFLFLHRDFWVHCSSHRTLLLGHPPSMKTLRLRCLEPNILILVLFNSSTHNFHKIWKSFLQTELQSLRLSELVLELQLLILVFWMVN